eukprot:2959038-Prorocentrum_lima.AAC.1
MSHTKVEADTITYSAAISACEKGGEWEKAVELLASMEHAKVEADEITYNAAISACENGSKWEKA